MLDHVISSRLLSTTLLSTVVISSLASDVWGQTAVSQHGGNAEVPSPWETSTALDPPAANPMGQILNVSELSDIEPGHWAYAALSDLVMRYNCLAGYPDGAFRGNRVLSRYEFAAGLNTCMQQMERLLSEVDADFRAEFEILQRLQTEFSPELETLSTRTDELETRVQFLEDNQFSTTTRLFGQVVVGLQGRTENSLDFFPVDGVRDLTDPFTEPNLIYNAQLTLLTQFSSRGILLTGLQAGAGNTSPLRLTNDTRLVYEGDTNNELRLSDLTYRHLLNPDFAMIVGPVGVNPVSVFRGANRVESAGFGPLSSLSQRNPILNIGGGSGGLGLDWQISRKLSLQGVYATSLPNSRFGGLFGGDFGDTVIGLQAAIAPTRDLDLTLNYLTAYSPLGTLRTGIGDELVVPTGIPARTHALGATASWQVDTNVTLGGWLGYTTSKIPAVSGNVETFNWMTFVNFPDLLGEGNLGGLYFGQPTRITSSTLPTGLNLPSLLAGGAGTPGGQTGQTLHFEAFYRWQVTDNIAVTPGVIVIFEPAHTPSNPTIGIGAVRVTLAF